jgi:periplasmic copper chaperone A|tara:strand:- start:132069 stop:132506 length:438 start_codon:yes stop_codon:yes gene_type:complete
MRRLLVVIVALFMLPIGATAQQGDIVVSGEWARPILIAGRPGGAYFHIKNNGAMADKLIGVTSSVSARVEMHEHTMKDGVMKMSQVMSIDVPAGGTVELKPGGYHIMLFETNNKYGPGDKIDLTLKFESGVTVEKELDVLAKQPN